MPELREPSGLRRCWGAKAGGLYPGLRRRRTMRFKIVIAALLAVAVVTDVGVTLSTRRAEAVEGKVPAADPGAAIAQLQARVNELEGRVPDQAIVMTHVAYHFTNLWFAARQHNWPLADFYLGEVRKDLKWAVRVRPVREGPAGG